LEEEPPTIRSAATLLRALIERETLGWKEIRQGEKGLRVEDVRVDLSRDLTTSTDAGGGFLAKGTSPKTLSEATQAQTVCDKAGAQFSRPDGDWSNLPKRLTPATAYWVNPVGGVAPTESNGTFGLIPVSSKEIAANVDYTRPLQVQTNGLVETMLLAELTTATAVGLDKAALVGSGSASEPHGIINTTGIGSTSGAAFALTAALEMIRMIEAANLFPTAFVISPTTAKLLRGRQRFTDSDTPILSGGMIADVPAFVTTSMPDDKIICGDFRQLLVLAESLQLLVNRYTQGRSGIIEVTAILFADVAVRNPGAFSVATSVS
jgi:HK97 family phage major capsid protein